VRIIFNVILDFPGSQARAANTGVMLSTETTSPDHLSGSCSVPSKIIAVLSEFNIRKLQVIHVFYVFKTYLNLASWLVSSGLIARLSSS